MNIIIIYIVIQNICPIVRYLPIFLIKTLSDIGLLESRGGLLRQPRFCWKLPCWLRTVATKLLIFQAESEAVQQVTTWRQGLFIITPWWRHLCPIVSFLRFLAGLFFLLKVVNLIQNQYDVPAECWCHWIHLGWYMRTWNEIIHLVVIRNFLFGFVDLELNRNVWLLPNIYNFIISISVISCHCSFAWWLFYKLEFTLYIFHWVRNEKQFFENADKYYISLLWYFLSFATLNILNA